MKYYAYVFVLKWLLYLRELTPYYVIEILE